MEQRRVLGVRAEGHGPGSGYVLAGRLVLTCAHLVGSVGTRVRVFRMAEGTEYDAEVVWRGTPGARDDGALLAIRDPGWGPGSDVSVRWGRTVTFQPRLACRTWGVPDAVQPPGAGSREPVEAGQPSGTLSPGDGIARDRYVIDLEGAVPDAHDRHGSPWGGLSGGALFCGDLLIGVLMGALEGWGNRRLTAATAYSLHAAEGFTRVLEEYGAAGPLEPAELQDIVESAAADRGGPVPSPVSLLVARRAVVPFHGREELLADLEARAADTGDRVAAWLVHGPGGQGKSRLARELSARLLAAGWVVAWPRPTAAPADLTVLAKAARATLIVVDYAESRTTQLGVLLGELAARREGAPVRVLLLARTEGWWRDLAADLPAARELINAASVSRLPVLDASGPGRHAAYREAVNAFARALPDVAGQQETDWAGLAGALPAPRVPDASVLGVHMTALADLLDAAHPGAAGPGERDVEDRLLEHEYGYWYATATAQLLAPALSRATLREAMAAAHLCTAATRREADALLACTPGLADQPYDRRRAVRSWIAALYPSTTPGTPWDGLRPDRLAERFLGRHLAGEPELADALVPDATPDQAARLLTVYARAAAHPVFEHGLDPELTELVLRHFTTLASATIAAATRVEYPGPLLRALERAGEDPGTSPGELARLEALLPPASHVLGDWAARLTARVVAEHRRAGDDSAGHPAKLASALRRLSGRLHAIEHREEALSAITEAVLLNRELADDDPSAHLPELARCLNALAGRLAELGRIDEAFLAAAEAVEIYGRLPAGDPDVLFSAISALSGVSSRLTQLGQPEVALTAIVPAVDLLRRLAEAVPEGFQHDLAAGLFNYSKPLFALGRWEEGLAVASEALGLFRSLAAEHPDAFLPSFATALSAYAPLIERREERMALITEALGIYRRLAADRREAYLPELAVCLDTLADMLAESGQAAEALTAAAEAVELHRELAQLLPEAFQPALGSSLDTLAATLAAAGRHEEALASATEAVALYRELAREQPEAVLPDLATALRNLGGRLADLGRLAEAADAAAEAVEIRRRTNTTPARSEPLAVTLTDYALRLHMLGNLEEAAATLTEAAASCRQLAESDPEESLSLLAGIQAEAARWWRELEREEEALASAVEAVDAGRQLAVAGREEFLPGLAEGLDTLTGLLTEDGQFEEALTAAEEAVGIWRRLAAADPGEYLFRLGSSLVELPRRLVEAGRPGQSLAVATEAVEIWRRLAADNPGRYLPGLAAGLYGLHNRLAAEELPAQAVAAITEAVEIWRSAAAEPRWLPGLAESLDARTQRLDEMGRPEEALASVSEAVGCYRRLVTSEQDRYRYQYRLVIDLEDLSERLDRFGRPDESLTAALEHADACRRLAEMNPDFHGPRAARSLQGLADRFRKLGRHQESLAKAAEAVEAWRQVNRELYGGEQLLPELAESLGTFADRLAEAGRQEEAAAAAVEAFEVRRRRARTCPASERTLNAACLSVNRSQLAELGRPHEALAAAEEAVVIYRTLAEAHPDEHVASLASGLRGLMFQLEELERHEEAVAAAEESAELYRSLAQSRPEEYLPELASGLSLLTYRLAEAGRPEQALAAAEESAELYRSLAQSRPEKYLPELASRLDLLTYRLAEAGRPEQAAAAAEEAVATYRQLAGPQPDTYLPRVMSRMNTRAIHLGGLGRWNEVAATISEAYKVYQRITESHPDTCQEEFRTLALILNWLQHETSDKSGDSTP